MKIWGVLLLIALLIDPGKASKINTLKSEAKKAFETGDFKTAISKYKILIDSLGVTEEEVRMNLAHAYFKAQDTLNSLNAYMPLSQSQDRHIRSLANQQLGVLANRQSKREEALNYFKQALKAAPENDDARYNYEMVKKKIEDEKKKDQQNKDKKDNKDQKDQDKKDQKDQKNKDEQKKDDKDSKDKKDQKDQKKDDPKDKQDKDKKEQQEKADKEKQDKEKKEKEAKEKEQQEKSDQKKENEIPPSVKEKLQDMQMSEEKAKMILEAMKNQEKQYLQQNKRKPTKPKEKGKPDW